MSKEDWDIRQHTFIASIGKAFVISYRVNLNTLL